MIQGSFYQPKVDFKTSKPTKTTSEAALSAPQSSSISSPSVTGHPIIGLVALHCWALLFYPFVFYSPPRFPGPAWCEYAQPQHHSPWAEYHGPSLLSFWPMTGTSVLTQVLLCTLSHIPVGFMQVSLADATRYPESLICVY